MIDQDTLGQFQIAIAAPVIEQVFKAIIDDGYNILLMDHRDGFYCCSLVSRSNGTDFNGYGEPAQAAGDAVKGWYAIAAKQPCGHPASAIVSSDEGTHYCKICEAEAKLFLDDESSN